MKRWLLIVVVICILLVALISGMQARGAWVASGNESRLSTIMREFRVIEGNWCWRGLCLNQTHLNEASFRLRDKAIFGDLANLKDQSTAVTWEWRDHPEWYGLLAHPRNDKRVSRFNFRLHDDTLMLADVLALFGTPQTLYIQVTGILTIQICFEHDVCVWVVQRNGLVTPAAPIIGIDFMTAEAFQAQAVYGVEAIPWRGFTNYTPSWSRVIN